MTTKEKIEVMQAYLDGKPIESKPKKPRYREETGWASWVSHTEPVWDFWSCEYRIKPEPRIKPGPRIPIEEWRVLYKDGSWSPSYGIARAAKAVLNATSGAERVVHFREVIEDDQTQSES